MILPSDWVNDHEFAESDRYSQQLPRCFIRVQCLAYYHGKWNSIIEHKMNLSDYSGELRCDGEAIAYYSALGDWSVPISDVRLIGEYTNSDGPYLDDYFFVFLTAPEGGWHQASFYAKGRDEALAVLSRTIGAPLECELCNSAQYKTRIMWPPHLKDQDLMEVLPLKNKSFWQRFTNFGAREIRLSEAARRAFEK